MRWKTETSAAHVLRHLLRFAFSSASHQAPTQAAM